MRTFNVIVRATIELGGDFEGENESLVIEEAKSLLKTQGELTDIVVERVMILNDEEIPDGDPGADY